MDKFEAPLFGVAGFPPNFFSSQYGRKRENIFQWINALGLNWIELQCTYGVKMKIEQARLYKELADKYDIKMSVHAPYYITLASKDKDIIKRSLNRIIQSFELANWLGSNRIIFHPGYFSGSSDDDRKAAVKLVVDGLNAIKSDIPSDKIFIYPETAGKKKQLGSVEDIISICEGVSYARPCLDLAHVHGFTSGKLTTSNSIIEILDIVGKRLGREILDSSHFHVYPVQIDHTGEKKHKAFEDVPEESDQCSLFKSNDDSSNCYFPRADHFIEAIVKKKLNPVIICEARDTQDIGALLMKDLFELSMR